MSFVTGLSRERRSFLSLQIEISQSENITDTSSNHLLKVEIPLGNGNGSISGRLVRHAYYKYYVFVRPEQLKAGWDRDRIMNAVTAEGAPCFSGSCSEVYLEKAFEGFDGDSLRPPARLPVAKELGETSLMFLVHPTLTEKDMETVVAAVRKVMKEAGK